MSTQKEAIAHFDICIDHLGNVWNTLKAIKEHSGHPLVGPAFRYALIEYSIPFACSEGTAIRRHRLDAKYVPEHFLELHKRIVSSRNQVLAHTDLSILEPQVSWSVVNGQRLLTRVQNNVSGLEELQNVDSILQLIEETLDRMLIAREELVLKLEP